MQIYLLNDDHGLDGFTLRDKSTKKVENGQMVWKLKNNKVNVH